MHIHILGICGTFMGGIALLAKQAGHVVTGSDDNVYPPMSTQLEQQGIGLTTGYDPSQLEPEPDVVVIGNALSRGNPVVEAVLEKGLTYTSGPQWLAEHFLSDRWVLAVAGTHGKTTTTSMLAWILEYAGLNPGFLVGGIPGNFGISARAGDSPFFVMEADEYDTAFFDKRSKFVHYHPRTAILNNLEYDHADIFADLSEIQKQFHHFIRTIPANGLIVNNADSPALADVLKMGCWTPVETFSSDREANWTTEGFAGSETFHVFLDGESIGKSSLSLPGEHNQLNALAAIAAARHAGVPVETSLAAIDEFMGVKRRLELRGEVVGIQVYDDFAHHPTAIRLTIEALQKQDPNGRILAVLEPRSNTMRMGVHKDALAASLSDADAVFLFQPADANWHVDEVASSLGDKAIVESNLEHLINAILEYSNTGDRVLIMSNGGFGNIHLRLLEALS
ncbi:MAG: UDP-N-acetylmuramate:L-alanyl-gamma-D-glutamyl-meso-diaminopimelate ligase [Gammaproteobacteria bacterium]|nr:MAG: UDP-N-acetylmuramate:L-alanyl-gamma-D-glutamyl-meso-diaminopimelate ligase [Gammaproteobacteria bacterium]